MNSTLICVPTYNEAQNIGKLLTEIFEHMPDVDVLVADDNSPDGTQELVRERMATNSRIHLLARPKKEGLGAAYIAAFQWGLARGYEAFMEMDADFSHHPRDAARMLQALGGHDVVIGCRYMNEGAISGWGLMRQGISRGGNIYARFILGMPFQDLTGGFNLWRRKVLETIEVSQIRSNGYAFQIELKYKAYLNDFRIREIPIHFQNREFGKSKMAGSIVYEAAYRVLEMRKNAGLWKTRHNVTHG